jgi:hypothetical protein
MPATITCLVAKKSIEEKLCFSLGAGSNEVCFSQTSSIMNIFSIFFELVEGVYLVNNITLKFHQMRCTLNAHFRKEFLNGELGI